MSLPLLAAIVVLGIAATVIAVHLTGGSHRATLSGFDQALGAFRTDFPDIEVGNAVMTANGESAFLDLADGRTGIVQSFGDGFFTRVVSPADIAEIRLREPAIVSIRFRDFTWTGGHFAFADPVTAKTTAARLGFRADRSR
ncbi:MAG: hypothetical protein KF723_12640 [Rhizobiaceae bacterium]|nr:hypothetical protein [Rhizobiaceae bacterium]